MLGIDGYVVRVEADSSPGTPALAIIGLPDRALNEARERVRSAIFNSGFMYPAGRLLINLSPGELPLLRERYIIASWPWSDTCAANQRCSAVIKARSAVRKEIVAPAGSSAYRTLMRFAPELKTARPGMLLPWM
jgi:hypothetical protein